MLHSIDSCDTCWNVSISLYDVYKALSECNSRKACGPDGIPTILYKKCASVFSIPLAAIFNFTISTCTFPTFWKHAHVIPIPKMKNPTIRDLRPISLLSLPSQIFEHFIFNSVGNTLYKSYDDDQGGCRPQSSTCCASMLLVCLIQLQFLVSRSLLLTQLATTSFQYLNTALLLAPTFSSPNCAMTGPWTSQKNKY